MNFLWGWSYKPWFESSIFTLWSLWPLWLESPLQQSCPYLSTFSHLAPGSVCVCVCVCACALSHVWYFVTPWAVDCQTPLSMEFSRQEYWNGWPFPSPGDLPNPGIKPVSLVSPALAGKFFTSWATGKPRDQALVTLKYVNTIWSNCFQIFLWCWDISDMYQNCSLQNSKEEVFCLMLYLLFLRCPCHFWSLNSSHKFGLFYLFPSCLSHLGLWYSRFKQKTHFHGQNLSKA